MVRRILDVVFWIAISAYFGGMLTLGAIVAPAVFDTTKAKNITLPGVAAPPLDGTAQAGGEIFGVALQRFEFVEFGAIILLGVVIGLWMFKVRLPRFGTWLLASGWVLLTCLTLYNAAVLTPWVLSARDKERSTAAQHMDANAPWPEKATFDSLHGQSTGIAELELVLLLGMMGIAAWRNSSARPRPAPPKAPKAAAAPPAKK